MDNNRNTALRNRLHILSRPRLVAFVLFGVVVLLLSTSAFFSTSPAGPPPSHTFRIVAVGDLHGDLYHAQLVLRRAGVLDEHSNWVGGNTVLVQTGDIVDRGTETIALYSMMGSLRTQAHAAGGAVMSLLGNHEIMNAVNDWRYVTKEDEETFGGVQQRRDAMREGWIGQTWRTNYSVASRVQFTTGFQLPVSPSSYLYPPPTQASQLPLGVPSSIELSTVLSKSAASFVHGGITPSYLRSLHPPNTNRDYTSSINEIGSSLLNSLLTHLPMSGLPRDAPAEVQHLYSAAGPLWDRTYAIDDDEEAVCRRAKEACDLLNVEFLVMGHTPHFEGIRTRCGGSVVLIDTGEFLSALETAFPDVSFAGISRAYGGRLSALEIAFSLVHHKSRSSSQVWKKTEVVSALYVDQKESVELVRREKLVDLSTA